MYAKLPEGLPSGGYGWMCSRSDVLAPVHHTGAAGGDVHGRLQFTSTNHVPGAKPRAGAPPFLGKKSIRQPSTRKIAGLCPWVKQWKEMVLGQSPLPRCAPLTPFLLLQEGPIIGWQGPTKGRRLHCWEKWNCHNATNKGKLVATIKCPN